MSLYVCPGGKSNCNALTHGDMVSLDEGRFPTLELNNRRLSVKNSFCRKNGVYTRSVAAAAAVAAVVGGSRCCFKIGNRRPSGGRERNREPVRHQYQHRGGG